MKVGAAGALGLIALASPVAKAATGICALTPPQTPGPFYPGEKLFHVDMDLTSVNGRRALGQIIYVRGRILDQKCNPIKGAIVEIWQACASGKYNNPNDPNPALIDPNFKYWSEMLTNENGEYLFKTIRPGVYPADADWVRPSHIHFKVSCLGYLELVTQMYFKGDVYNERDLILQKVPAMQRSSVIVDFQTSTTDFEPGSLTGIFDITLRPARG